MVKSGKTSEDLIYQKIVGLKDDLSGPQNIPAILEDDNYDSSISISEDESSEESYEEKSKFSNSSRPKNEDTESKRVRFQLISGLCKTLIFYVCLLVKEETSKRR